MARLTVASEVLEDIDVFDEHVSLARAQNWGASHYDVLPVARRSMLEIPPEKIPPGFDYAWKRVMVGTEFDENNWQNLHKEMWIPVKRSRHPDLFLNIPHTPKNPVFEGLIYYKGVVLFERPTHYSSQIELQNKRDDAQKLAGALNFDSQLIAAGYGDYLDKHVPGHGHMTKPGRGYMG